MKYKAYVVQEECSLKSEPIVLKDTGLCGWGGLDTMEECKDLLIKDAKNKYSELKCKNVVILPFMSFDYNGELGE